MLAVEALTRALREGAEGAPHPAERRATYLHPGQLLTAAEPHAITTVLGSCVAVCLHDRRLRAGGMNHFLLPSGGMSPASNRIGSTAMPALLAGLQRLGSHPADLEARVFGGACVLDAFRGHPDHLGVQNAAAALAFLRDAGVRVVEQDTGGLRGRKLRFHTDDGSVSLQQI